MLPLNNGDTLLYQIAGNSVHDLLEKLSIVVKCICHHKFWLKVLPNFVMLLSLNSLLECNRLFKILVECLGAFPILSKVVDSLITWFAELFFGHLEHLFLLVEVNEIIVA